jgi:hypothetical protein
MGLVNRVPSEIRFPVGTDKTCRFQFVSLSMRVVGLVGGFSAYKVLIVFVGVANSYHHRCRHLGEYP